MTIYCVTDGRTTRERLHDTDTAAHQARRRDIEAGRQVSLVAYDGDRRKYVYDVTC